MTDISLYQQVRAGDDRALRQLFDQYMVELCVFVEQYVLDEQVSQDIVQEFFIKVWQKRGETDIQRSFKAYAYRSVYLASLNHIRDEKRKGIKEDLAPYADTIASIDPNYMEQEESRQLHQRLQLAMGKLPPQCRRIFEKVHLDDMKYEEVARELGLSINTVKVQMSKAYRLLRESLGSSEFTFVFLLLLGGS